MSSSRYSQFSTGDSSHPLLGSLHPEDRFQRGSKEEKGTQTNGFDNGNKDVTGYQPIAPRYRDVSETGRDNDRRRTGTTTDHPFTATSNHVALKSQSGSHSRTRLEERPDPKLVSEDPLERPSPMPSLQKLDRSYLIPKRRIALTRNGQDNKKTGYDVQPQPVLVYSEDERLPRWGQMRKSPGVKRGRNYNEGQQSNQRRSTLEDGHCMGEYATSEFEDRRSSRIRLAPSRDDDDDANRQARLKRFRHDIDSRTTSNQKQERSSRGRRDARVFRRSNAAYHENRNRVSQPAVPSVSSGAPSTGSGEKDTLPNLPTGSNDSTSVLADRMRRPIVIDGCNVAFERSQGKCFECKAIQVCVDYFLKDGFTEIIVVVPEFRLSDRSCKDLQVLQDLQDKGMVLTCWSGEKLNGQRYSSYDDLLIIKVADRRGGVIISNDRYRDVLQTRPEWATTIDERVVGFRFMPGVPDEIMFPSDPFGRYGPSLDELLRF